MFAIFSIRFCDVDSLTFSKVVEQTFKNQSLAEKNEEQDIKWTAQSLGVFRMKASISGFLAQHNLDPELGSL